MLFYPVTCPVIRRLTSVRTCQILPSESPSKIVRKAQQNEGDPCDIAAFQVAFAEAQVAALHSIVASPCPQGYCADIHKRSAQQGYIFAAEHGAPRREQILCKQRYSRRGELAGSCQHLHSRRQSGAGQRGDWCNVVDAAVPAECRKESSGHFELCCLRILSAIRRHKEGSQDKNRNINTA